METIEISATEEMSGTVLYEYTHEGIGYRYEWDGGDTGTYTMYVYEDGGERSKDLLFKDHTRADADRRMVRTVEAGAFLINAKLCK